MDVSIIGTGYVGLVTGACLAQLGHQVTCVDMDPEKVRAVREGRSPIFEEGLDALLSQNVGRRLSATSDLRAAVLETDLSLIAVGTPFDGHSIDRTAVEQAVRSVGMALAASDRFHTVVVKSTVVPGTTDTMVRRLLEGVTGKRCGEGFGLGMNPEFLREGMAVRDFLEPDRIVLGADDPRSMAQMEALYAVFGNVDRIRTTTRTAETIKYASNALFATLISFSNEMGNLCGEIGGVDVVDVLHGVHLDRRISPVAGGKRVTPGMVSYLAAGCGFGGSCFPKDVKALVAEGERVGQPLALLRAVMDINERQPQQVVALVEAMLQGVAQKQVTVLGAAFKPGTDDLRESPAIPIVTRLNEKGAYVRLFDPVASIAARQMLGDVAQFSGSLEESVDGAQAVVLVTAWPEFADLEGILGRLGQTPWIVDGRRFYDKDRFAHYAGVGLSA